ncbi:MAG TPA: serine hydrolase domain-containing protein [Kiloniellales bacterium]|nr:serine hydrolase domain-containing protein [Kiloniellales bacterium]
MVSKAAFAGGLLLHTPLLPTLLLTPLLLGAAAAQEQEPAPALPPVDIAAVVESVLGPERPPIIQVAISDEQGTSIISLARPGVPVAEEEAAPELRFAYRSITKSFVGTLVLQLVQEGALHLDEPLATYVEGIPGGEDITLRHLGTMRTGLPNYSSNSELIATLLEAPAREPARGELLDMAFTQEASFEPGSSYEYSNTNTLLLGAVIEAVTGVPWHEAVRWRILEPLRLTSVRYGFEEEAPAAEGFHLEAETVAPLPQVAPGWFGASGALTGTLQDLVVWGRALGSGSLLNDELQAERLATFAPTDADPRSPFYHRYGFALGEIDGWIGHTGAGLGYQSLVMYEPETERVIAILMNGTGGNRSLPAEIFQALLASLPAP